MKNNKVAFITGITGQDGSLLAEMLLKKNYQVHGMLRRASTHNTPRIDSLIARSLKAGADNFKLHYGDVTDSANIISTLDKVRPNEVYHLAGQSDVQVSFDVPEYTANATGLGTLRVLEALRVLGMKDDVKFYQASSSEIYGNSASVLQNEQTPFRPCSPYGIAKLYAYWMTVSYREAYGFHASNGILFNHESSVRGEMFVTRKISLGVAAIHAGKAQHIMLGNLDAKRDWGHARDYVDAMWRMLQQKKPDDYVIATGETHSIREFVELAFSEVGRHIVWKGKDAGEKGVDKKTGQVLVKINPSLFRPKDIDCLMGDSSKAKKALGWKSKTTFPELVQEMVQSDIRALERGSA